MFPESHHMKLKYAAPPYLPLHHMLASVPCGAMRGIVCIAKKVRQIYTFYNKKDIKIDIFHKINTILIV